MFNEIDSDVVFYKEMHKVYNLAAIAFIENMAAEKRRKEERASNIAAGLIISDHQAMDVSNNNTAKRGS